MKFESISDYYPFQAAFDECMRAELDLEKSTGNGIHREAGHKGDGQEAKSKLYSPGIERETEICDLRCEAHRRAFDLLIAACDAFTARQVARAIQLVTS